ncbi:hypothetical protein OG215_39225 (plasmid) [Streptomyces globisporus]|uniref:hypothetical protein n=1 Tax=Streptomyces globisporus TaxID=1908 RepID=UPI002F90868D|nr:hypothetical protein OG215_39225 [Streptomyces globisporus]
MLTASRPGLSILTAKAHEGLARDLLDRLAHPDSQGVTYGQLHRYAAGKGYTLTAHDLNDLRSQTTPRAVAEAADEADPQQEHMGTGAASHGRSRERNAAALKVVFQQPGWAELGKVKAGGISPVTRLPKTGTQVELHGDTRLVNIGTRVAKLQKSGSKKVSPQEEAVLTLQGFTIREGRLVRAGGIRSAVAPGPGAVTVPDVPVTPLRPRSSYQQPSGSEPVLRKETTRPRQNNDVLLIRNSCGSRPGRSGRVGR